MKIIYADSIEQFYSRIEGGKYEDIKHNLVLHANGSLITIEEAIPVIKKTGCHGFCYGTGDILVWVAPDCAMKELVHVMAHEYYHSKRPISWVGRVVFYYRRFLKSVFGGQMANEENAGEWGDAAAWAYETAEMILREVNKK